MKIKSSPSHSLDAKAAYVAANAFFGNAGDFFSKFEPEKTTVFTAPELGRLVAATTNLSLAIELYFKCMLIVLKPELPQIHDLGKLFDALPKTLQESVEAEYESRTEGVDPSSVKFIEITSTKKFSPPQPDLNSSAAVEIPTLRELLEAERNSFLDWRYFHEGTLQVYSTNFQRLGVLANVLQKHIKPVPKHA